MVVDGVFWFVNLLMVFGMIEMMWCENYKVLVYMVVVFNFGQMFNKICIKDGIGFVNIVCSKEQVEILCKIGVKYIVDFSVLFFIDDFINVLVEIGVMIVFDVIGGGKFVSQIFMVMEVVVNRIVKEYSCYGFNVYKQVYIYGSFDNCLIELSWLFGLIWGVGGWLLMLFLQKIGLVEIGCLCQCVVFEFKIIFVSYYIKVVLLIEVFDFVNIVVYVKWVIGEKFFINLNK